MDMSVLMAYCTKFMPIAAGITEVTPGNRQRRSWICIDSYLYKPQRCNVRGL